MKPNCDRLHSLSPSTCMIKNRQLTTAHRLGFPAGTIIYFAVDYDVLGYEIHEKIVPYFQEINETFDKITENLGVKRYKIGIYSSRNVCSTVRTAYGTGIEGLFVADMSSGYSGNLGFAMPTDWAFDQFAQLFGSSNGIGVDIDKVGYSGLDQGVSSVNPPFLSDKIFEVIFNEYIKIMEHFPGVNNIAGLVNFQLNKKFSIYKSLLVDIDAKVSASYDPDDSENSIQFSIVNGKLEGSLTQQMLKNSSVTLSSDQITAYDKILKNVSLEISMENISLSTNIKDTETVVTFTIYKKEVEVLDIGTTDMTLKVIYTIKHQNNDDKEKFQDDASKLNIFAAALIALGVAVFIGSVIAEGPVIGIASLIAFLIGVKEQ